MGTTTAYSYLDGLNEQQQAAVKSVGRPLLVLAGAGTGKTRVVTRRIAHLIETGVPADAILAVTFTKKAAAEMQERVAEFISDAGRQPTICTLHALGYRMLAENGVCVTTSGRVNLISTAEQRQLVAGLLAAFGHADELDVRATLREISRAKSVAAIGRPCSGDQWLARILQGYNCLLDQKKCVDFDDLLLCPVQLLRNSPQLRSQYQRRWQHILIDEYQDTNAVQHALIRLLVGPEGNICVVGDDDQSIYGFRGACADTILNFEREFPGASVIKLEQNYRSYEEILNLAGSVIGRASNRYPKRLQSQRGKGGLVMRERASDAATEAERIVNQMMERQRNGIRWDDMAVLYRVHSDSKRIENEMQKRDVPFQSVTQSSRSNKVTIMTLHRSKGLEFPVVFLPAMEEDTLPHYYAARNRNGVDEERRLFYVGITRARRELVLSSCFYRRGRDRSVSRFLTEVGLG